jgi:hypothetical protein
MKDLIELQETFEGETFQLFEGKDDPQVDGVNVLGRVLGEGFLVNGSSRNKRYYSQKLWENAIRQAQQGIEDGGMLGTIGHDQPLDDAAIRDGKASHRISKVWIENGKGMIEALILNTPAGRNLNGVLRGGTKFPVSSRAWGKFNGKRSDGHDIVDEEAFKLETFDFVRNQGVASAVPELVESKTDDNAVLENTGDRTMEIVEKITQEKLELQGRLNEVLDTNENLKGEKAVHLSKLEEAEKKIQSLEEAVADREELQKKVAVMEAAFDDLGAPEEIAEAFSDTETVLGQYMELGTPAAIAEALDLSQETVESYEDLGSPEQVAEAFDRIESAMEELGELGTIEEIRSVFEGVEKYVELGSVEEIGEVFAKSKSLADRCKNERLKSDMEEIQTSFGVSETAAAKLLDKMDKSEVSEVLGEMSAKRKMSKQYRRANEDGKSDDTIASMTESLGRKGGMTESRASRLSTSLGK